MPSIELERPDGDGRLDWLDLLRGVSILLVLVWHASAVPALFDWQMPEWLRRSNNALLPFRMPMLMFLSGLLLPRSLKKSRLQYYVGKLRTLVWPYILWVAIYLTQYEVAWPITNWHTWYASGYLWFLFFIAIYYFVAPVLVLLPRWLTPWIFMVASTPLAAGTEKRLLYFGAFFFLGYWFAMSPRLRGAVRGWVIPVIGSVAVAWAVVSSVYGTGLAYRGQFTLLSACGILFSTWLAARVPGPLVRPLTFVGRNSVVYYVAHFPVMTLVTHLSSRVDPTRNPYIPVINLVVALAVVTALAHLRRFSLIDSLFVMPAPLSRLIELLLVTMSKLSRRPVRKFGNDERDRLPGT